MATEPTELVHAFPAGEEPRQAQFLGILALGLLAFLALGALTAIIVGLTSHAA